MQELFMEKVKLKSLSKYKLSKDISNSEGEKYRIKGSVLKDENKNFIMKRLGNGLDKDINYNSEILSSTIYEVNKLYTIMKLDEYKEKINIEELVLASGLVIIDDKFINYFLIPEIENVKNLGVVLKDKKVKNEKKISYLYQVGSILDKVLKLDLDIKINIGDLREYNFILDEEEKLYVVDTDSFSLHTGYLTDSYYLCSMAYFNREQPRKYKDKINDDTDILCYTSMIFNTLLNNKLHKFRKNDYFNYLDYLKYLGFGKDILTSFKTIFTDEENINPHLYLDQIPLDKLTETDNISYKKYRLKRNLF